MVHHCFATCHSYLPASPGVTPRMTRDQVCSAGRTRYRPRSPKVVASLNIGCCLVVHRAVRVRLSVRGVVIQYPVFQSSVRPCTASAARAHPYSSPGPSSLAFRGKFEAPPFIVRCAHSSPFFSSDISMLRRSFFESTRRTAIYALACSGMIHLRTRMWG